MVNYTEIIYKSILDGDFDDSIDYKNIDKEVVFAAISSALEEVGDLFEKGTYFIPEMMAAGDVAKNILENIYEEGKIGQNKISIVIGSVYGDQHEIGKNIIKSILLAEGYQVYDLGANVKFEKFKESLTKNKSEILLLSCLTSASTSSLANIISMIRKDRDLSNVVVIIGGLASNNKIANETRADAYCAGPKDLLNYIKKIKKDDGLSE